MGSGAMQLATMRVAACLALVLIALNSADGAPLQGDIEALNDSGYDGQELGESAALGDEAMETEQAGEGAEYAAKKKKLEGKIKKVEKDLMKKASKVFAKLYAPIKKGPKPKLNSPLGADGQS